MKPSVSPWRAQIVVVTNSNHKRRLYIAYSQTIKKYAQLDGYPVPRMQDKENKVSQFNVSSTLNLKSACHQIDLPNADRKYTAFKANGRFYQFTKMPFGLKNAVPCFQRVIDDVIDRHGCEGTLHIWTM